MAAKIRRRPAAVSISRSMPGTSTSILRKGRKCFITRAPVASVGADLLVVGKGTVAKPVEIANAIAARTVSMHALVMSARRRFLSFR